MAFNSKFFKVVLAAAALTVVGCVNKAHRAEIAKSDDMERQSAEVSAAAAIETKSQNFAEIKFSPGTAALTDSAKSILDQAINMSLRQGKINEVIVMSWADSELPSKNRNKLSKAQMALADQRNKTVSKYLKQGRSVDVDTYNMASQPNVFSKWFNTTDAQLKNTLMAAGLPTTASSDQYPRKASHSVILVRVE
jgi:outer membrane protein OmpA-like peptidoglycan-associated protein